MILLAADLEPGWSATRLKGEALAAMVEHAGFWLAQKREIARGTEAATPDAATFLTGERLLVPRSAASVQAYYTDKGASTDVDWNIVRTARLDLDYLAAVLESSLTAFWLRQTGRFNGREYRVDVKALRGIPLYRGSPQFEALTARLTQIIRVTEAGETGSEFDGQRRSTDWRLLRDAMLCELVFPEEVDESRLYVFDEVRRCGIAELDPTRPAFAQRAAALAEQVFSVTRTLYGTMFDLRATDVVMAIDDRLGYPHPDRDQLCARLEARRKEMVLAAEQVEERRAAVVASSVEAS